MNENDTQDADGLGAVPDEETSEPIPEPEPEPQSETLQLPCAGCGTVYQFEVKPHVTDFTFDCQRCKTRSKWER